MSFTNPFSTKTDDISVVTALEFNNAGAAISQAIDGTGGGDYTPVTAPIRIGGVQGLRILSGGFLTILSGGTLSVPSGGIVTAASGSTVTLAGTTTAGDFTMTGTSRVKVASRSITRVQSSILVPTSATWIHSSGFYNQAVNNTNELACALRVPHGATLTSVQVRISPAGGHVGAPTMPSVSVGYVDNAGATNLVTTVDPTAFGSYETSHSFGPTGMSHVVDRSTRRYYAAITGETGANYVIGLSVYYVSCTYTITEYDED